MNPLCTGERSGVEQHFEIAAELVDVVGAVGIDRAFKIIASVQGEGVIETVGPRADPGACARLAACAG